MWAARLENTDTTRGTPPRARIHADRRVDAAVVARPAPRFGPSPMRCGVVGTRAAVGAAGDRPQPVGLAQSPAAAVWLAHLPSSLPDGLPRRGEGQGAADNTSQLPHAHDAGSDWSLALPLLLQCQRAHGPRRPRCRRDGPPLPLPCPPCVPGRPGWRSHAAPRVDVPVLALGQGKEYRSGCQRKIRTGRGVLVCSFRDDHEQRGSIRGRTAVSPHQVMAASKALGARPVERRKHGVLNKVDEVGVRVTSLHTCPHPPRSNPASAAVVLLYCTIGRNTSA